jgi:hypothetical protein
MAPLPHSIKVGRLVYEVVNDAATFHELCQGDLGVRATDHGATNHHRTLMAINPSDSLHQQADTLLHEVMHVCWFVSNADDLEKMEGEKEESTIARLTPWLTLVLAENPEVSAFIQNPEG